ncbi:MAG: helix-turn-helix domain-containing protein [Velocimicrobium sp.]
MKDFTHENIQIQPDIKVQFFTYEDSSHLVNNHWHNSLEILLIKSGKMNIWVDDHLKLAVKDDLVIINSKDIHATKCLEPSIIQLLQIPYSFLKESVADMDTIRFNPDCISNPEQRDDILLSLHSFLIQMGEVYESKENGYTLKFTSLIYELLYLLVKYCWQDISSTKKSQNDITHKRLTLVMNYVKEHYAEPITLKEAAGLVSLNPEYFCRYFKKNMGTTFLNYVNEVRMSYVYQNIINTNQSITQILSTHGFTNYKVFMHMFHEKYGCTPIQKRKHEQLSFPR